MADEVEGGIEPTEIVPPSRTIAGKYLLGRLIGEGGMGTVYEAEHTGLGVRVAIKILGEAFSEDGTFVRRFRREARAAAAVRHENVVAVTDTGTDEDGIPFLVMELLDGESLGSILRREKVLSPETACNVGRQILRGLGAAHREGVVHRDLKPANVFLAQLADGSQKVKILDFGISKFAMDASNVTAEGAVIGTPSYMAPEQVRGAEVDHRADLYAVGVMIYRMTTGKLPFGGKKSRQIYDRILAGNPVRPREIRSTIPKALDDVVIQAMALEPGDRFQTAEEMAEALEDAVPNLETTDPVPLITRSSVIPSTTNPGLARTIPSRASQHEAAEQEPPTRQERPSSAGSSAGTGRSGRRDPSETGESDASTSPRAARPAETTEQPAAGRSWTGVLAMGAAAAAIVGLVAWAASDTELAEGEGEEDPATEETPATMDEPPIYYAINRYTDEADVRAQHEPLARHLEDTLERPVELVVLEDYDLTRGLTSDEPRLTALSAYRYVEAKRDNPDLRLLATAANPGGSSYQGSIIALASSGFEDLDDLRGRVFCYVSTTSTSGYLYPRRTLRRADIDPDGDFRATQFTRDHKSSLRMLRRGSCDGAAVYAGVIHESDGFAPQEFTTLASTARMPHDAYVLTGDVPDEVANALRDALLELDPDGERAHEVLGEGSLRGFAPLTDADYDEVRTIIDEERRARERREREGQEPAPEEPQGGTEGTAAAP